MVGRKLFRSDEYTNHIKFIEAGVEFVAIIETEEFLAVLLLCVILDPLIAGNVVVIGEAKQ
jgi:hypothetical protein